MSRRTRKANGEKKKKVIIVEVCQDCGYYDEEGIWCRSENLDLLRYKGDIPPWCPLPDAKEPEEHWTDIDEGAVCP